MEAGSLDGDFAAMVILGGSVCISWIPGARGQPGSMEACSLDAPRPDFEWISSILCDLGWICAHFLDSRGPGSDPPD